MSNYLIAGQPVTREAVASAYIEALRDRGVVKVRVLCADCGTEITTTWLRSTDEVVPFIRCVSCEAHNEADY